MSEDKERGLDLSPSRKGDKKTVSVTLGSEARQLLEFLNRKYSTNISAFVDELLKTISKTSSATNPVEYSYELGQYRECTLLLRNEIADFLESWKNYGICGNANILKSTAKSSTPLEIARKLSFLIANDSEVMGCDSSIYGYNNEMINSKIERAGSKAKEVPKES